MPCVAAKRFFFFKDVFLPSVIFYINFAFLFLLLNLYKVKFAFFLLNLLFSLLSVLLVLYTKRSVCVCVCVCVLGKTANINCFFSERAVRQKLPNPPLPSLHHYLLHF